MSQVKNPITGPEYKKCLFLPDYVFFVFSFEVATGRFCNQLS